MERKKNNCIICEAYQAIEHTTDADSEFIHQTCPRCMEFKISRSLKDKLGLIQILGASQPGY